MTWFYKCLEKSALEFLEIWALAVGCPLPLLCKNRRFVSQ